ncbi:MAG: V-type ATPase subunit, partial [Erysipelotrichaceae bacterium]
MLSLSTNAISTKAKAMYGRRLRLNNYTELMHKRNITEIVSYLKQETDYKDILKDVRDNSIHRQQLEELLKQDLFEKGIKLMRYATASDLEFYKYEVYEIEIDLILSKLTQLINKETDNMKLISSIPMFMKKFTHFDMMNLAKATTYLEVAKCIKATPYANILKPYLVDETTMNFHQCEITLKKFYYNLIDQMIDKYYKK